MPDLSGLPVIDQTLGEVIEQAVPCLSRLEHDGAAIGARVRLIERGDEGCVK